MRVSVKYPTLKNEWVIGLLIWIWEILPSWASFGGRVTLGIHFITHAIVKLSQAATNLGWDYREYWDWDSRPGTLSCTVLAKWMPLPESAHELLELVGNCIVWLIWIVDYWRRTTFAEYWPAELSCADAWLDLAKKSEVFLCVVNSLLVEFIRFWLRMEDFVVVLVSAQCQGQQKMNS